MNAEVKPPTASTSAVIFFSLFRYFKAKTRGENTDSAFLKFIFIPSRCFMHCPNTLSTLTLSITLVPQSESSRSIRLGLCGLHEPAMDVRTTWILAGGLQSMHYRHNTGGLSSTMLSFTLTVQGKWSANPSASLETQAFPGISASFKTIMDCMCCISRLKPSGPAWYCPL